MGLSERLKRLLGNRRSAAEMELFRDESANRLIVLPRSFQRKPGWFRRLFGGRPSFPSMVLFRDESTHSEILVPHSVLQSLESEVRVREMPRKKVRVPFEKTFSEQEYGCLARGFTPENQDDKWFIFSKEDWVYFHRSWTGICIYQLRLESSGQGYRVAEAWVNNARKQYKKSKDNEFEASFLCWLIDYILLGKDLPAPQSPELRDWLG